MKHLPVKAIYFGGMLFLLPLLAGCLRLDDFLYNPSTEITEYLLNNYPGEVEIEVPQRFDVTDSLINLFTLNSVTPEGEAATIYGMYIGQMSRISTDTVILYCHGNKNHLDFYWPRIKLLANVGGKNRYGVMALDYRGYGLSTGEPSEAGLYADVAAAIDWLEAQGLEGSRLVMYGYSMGAAPATQLTAHPAALRPDKLILEAPFASAAVLVQDATSLAIPASFVTDLEIDNAEEIKEVEQPFLWLHGKEDEELKFETHGQVVYNNYRGSYKEAITVPGAGHTDVPVVLGYETYLQELLEFIMQ